MKNLKEFFSEKRNLYKFIFTLIVLALSLYFFSRFLIYNENRPGVILDDPVFIWFDAVNLNIIIFLLIYAGLITGIVFLIRHPLYLMIALQSYALLVLLRMLAMYLVPLEPPSGMIDLNDPLVFIFGTGQPVQKDLFFSGHTATMFLLFLTARNKKLKWIFLCLALLIGIFVILQKVHYCIDVLVAPFFSYAGYRIVYLLNKKISGNVS